MPENAQYKDKRKTRSVSWLNLEAKYCRSFTARKLKY